VSKGILVLMIIVGALLVFTSCSALDVVARGAEKGFSAMLSHVQATHNAAAQEWEIASPGSEIFSMADSYNTPADFRITFQAAPFLTAGLDPAKLPVDFVFDAATQNLVLTFDIADKQLQPESAATPLALLKALIATDRKAIGYHEALDHYGIALGGGNMLEWAKNQTTNDKDLVFVLNPEPFLKAGLDVLRLTDWIFAEVPVMDAKGKKINVPKLLKPYNFQ